LPSIPLNLIKIRRKLLLNIPRKFNYSFSKLKTKKKRRASFN